MAGSRDSRKGSGEWDPEEWPETEWDQGEAPPREGTVRERESAAGPRGRYEGGSEIRSDIRNVMDDPLYEPRPGDRALRERRPARGRPAVRVHARPARSGLSLGQKFLLWIGFAFLSAISFAAGIIVGAGGGIDLPWLQGFAPGAGERPAAVEIEDLGPPLAPDGVIRFGDRGTVPSETGEEGSVLRSDKAPAPEGGAPAGRAEAGMAPGGGEGVKAPEAPAQKVARKTAPAVKDVAPAKSAPAEQPAPESDPEPAPPEDSAAEMTFYETSTGEAAMPGLAGTGEDVEDDEAPPDPEPAVETHAVVKAAIPAAGERKAAAARAPEPEEADEGPPSGAEMLARRLSAGGVRRAPVPPAPAPASSTAVGGEIYTVQITTLADESEAKRLAERLKSRGFDARIVPLSRSGLGTLYRIRVGRYSSEEAARSDRDRLSSEPGAHPYIRME